MKATRVDFARSYLEALTSDWTAIQCKLISLTYQRDADLTSHHSDYRDKATVKSYLSQGKALLYPLKELGKALQSLTRHTEYAIYKIENKIQPLALHDGINSMPDEILAMIFESAISSDDVHDKWDARTLASVNHKFRTAALGSRILWSNLSHMKGKKVFKLFLKRSGNAPLTIGVGARPPKWFMDEVLALGKRWGTVVITKDKNDFMSQVCEYGQRKRAHQTYPKLQALNIYPPLGLSYGDSYSPWNIPTIKYLSCTNVITALSDESFASLTTLELTTDNNPLKRILRQLYFMRNLQNLSLTLGPGGKCWAGDEYPDCDLKSLRCLHLTWSAPSVYDLNQFLDKITMENVKSVELDFLKAHEDVISWEIGCVIGHRRKSKPSLRFPVLEDITIIAEPREGLDNLTLGADVFLHYPKLKSLRLQVPFIEPLDCHPTEDYGLDIKTITIVGCVTGARDFLEHLLSHINPDDSRLCSGLTSLEVWGCADATMNFLMDYLPEEKFDFLPYEAPHF